MHIFILRLFSKQRNTISYQLFIWVRKEFPALAEMEIYVTGVGSYFNISTLCGKALKKSGGFIACEIAIDGCHTPMYMYMYMYM